MTPRTLTAEELAELRRKVEAATGSNVSTVDYNQILQSLRRVAPLLIAQAERAIRLEQALRQWDCDRCKGHGRIAAEAAKKKYGENTCGGEGGTTKCGKCDGVGINPIAYVALKEDPMTAACAVCKRRPPALMCRNCGPVCDVCSEEWQCRGCGACCSELGRDEAKAEVADEALKE